MDRGRDHVVTALTPIDMVIGMDLAPETLTGKPGDDLIGIHIGACARARLEDIDRKMRIMLTLSYFRCGRLDRLGHASLHKTKLMIGLGGCFLDEAERPDNAAR